MWTNQKPITSHLWTATIVSPFYNPAYKIHKISRYNSSPLHTVHHFDVISQQPTKILWIYLQNWNILRSSPVPFNDSSTNATSENQIFDISSEHHIYVPEHLPFSQRQINPSKGTYEKLRSVTSSRILIRPDSGMHPG